MQKILICFFSHKLSSVKKASQELSDANELISEKSKVITENGRHMQSLSCAIKKSTSLYNILVEAEKKRLESNADFGVQMTPAAKDVSVAADFIAPVTSFRSTDLLCADNLEMNDIPVVFRPSTRAASSRSSLKREMPPRSASSLRTKEFLIGSMY